MIIMIIMLIVLVIISFLIIKCIMSEDTGCSHCEFFQHKYNKNHKCEWSKYGK